MIAKFIKMSSSLNTKSGLSFNTSIGNVPLEKEKTIIKYEATIIAKNDEICKISKIQNPKSLDTTYVFKDEIIKVKLPIADNTIDNIATAFNVIKEAVTATSDKPLDYIYDGNDNLIGSFDRKVITGENINDNYQYNVIKIHDRFFSVYLLADNNSEKLKGINLYVYDEQEKLVGVITKDRKVKNSMATYNIYTKEEDIYKYLCIICDTWHQMVYETDDLGYSVHNERTWSNLVREKYNPAYIEQVISSTASEYQIENMPLVAQRLNESKKSKTVIIGYISLGIIILLIILAMIFSEEVTSWLGN